MLQRTVNKNTRTVKWAKTVMLQGIKAELSIESSQESKKLSS